MKGALPSHAQRWLWRLLICGLVLAAYGRGLRHGLVYDDHGMLEENTFLASPGNALRLFTGEALADARVVNGRRPLVLLTYFMDRACWGLNPAGYHATNVLLHLLASILVLSLFQRWLCASPAAGGPEGPPSPALDVALAGTAALIFSLHPLLVEAVQVPAFRADILCAVNVGCFLLAGTARAPTWVLAAPLFLLAALLSKETALFAPVLLLAAWWLLPAARPGWKYGGLASLLCAGVATVIFSIWCLQPSLQAANAHWNGIALVPPANFFTAPWLWVLYWRWLAWPWPLSADHMLVPVTGWLSPPFAAGMAALLFTLVWLVYLIKKQSAVAALGLIWMLVFFLPVSNLWPLFNPMAERYAYLLAPGFALLVAGLSRQAQHIRRWRIAVSAAVIAAAYLLVIQLRLPAWANDEKLWSAVLETDPGSARAHTWLGLIRKSQGRAFQARSLFLQAAKLNPQEASALINLAILAGAEEEYAAAESYLRDAIKRQPDNAHAWWNLAVALDRQGRTNEAATAAATARRLNPWAFQTP